MDWAEWGLSRKTSNSGAFLKNKTNKWTNKNILEKAISNENYQIYPRADLDFVGPLKKKRM